MPALNREPEAIRPTRPPPISTMIVDCAYYKDRQRQNDKPLSLERARECMDTGMGFVWLGMKDPTPEEVAQATRAFDVPELAIEEASEVHQRPKLDEHGDHFFGVVKTAWYEETKEEVHFGQIHVFLGPGYVVTRAARRGRRPEAGAQPSGGGPPGSARRRARGGRLGDPRPGRRTTTSRWSAGSTTTSRRSSRRCSRAGPSRRSGSTS